MEIKELKQMLLNSKRYSMFRMKRAIKKIFKEKPKELSFLYFDMLSTFNCIDIGDEKYRISREKHLIVWII